jgi:excisionase family DNA binding protein
VVSAVSDRLIPSPQTAEVFGVSPRTIRRWAKQGILDPVRVGGSTRYRLSDIEATIREGTRGPDRRLA